MGKPPGAEDFLARLSGVASIKPVTGFKALMHNKYVIRDGPSADAALLTGSTNFTTDSWSLQENNLITLHSQELAAFYATDFEQLWSRGKITEFDRLSRHRNGSRRGRAGDGRLHAGRERDHRAQRSSMPSRSRRHALSIAAMVMSSGPICAAVCEAIDRGVPISGLYDGPQMDTVLRQWSEAGVGADKVNGWHKIAARLARKESIPYAPGSPHNFMHDKLIVADDVVVSGSFNFSNHARGNAENTLLIKDKAIADAYDRLYRGPRATLFEELIRKR